MRVSEQYRELMHYTTAGGLEGILTSGCLWATSASFLNDSVEVQYFFDTRLVEIVGDVVTEEYEALANDPAKKAKMDDKGGLATLVESETKSLVNILRTNTLRINQPHVFSFSAPRSDRVRSSGLLSQWRGYGRGGGYALVFEAGALEALLEKEAKAHRYQHVQWGDVYYHSDPTGQQAAEVEVREAETTLRAAIKGMLHAVSPSDIEPMYQPITTLSCTFKHWGFHEECEVRIIAIPLNHKVAKKAQDGGEVICLNPVKFFAREGILVPYIELFRNLPEPTKLPILRVVVGPHRDARLRRQAVEILLRANGYDAEVVVSEIPFLGL